MFLDAFVNVMHVDSVFSPCMSGSLLAPQQQSERGIHVCLSLLSVIVEPISDREILWGLGGYRGENKENGFI